MQSWTYKIFSTVVFVAAIAATSAGARAEAAKTAGFIYWLEVRSGEVDVRDGPDDSDFLCADIKTNERVRILGVGETYYKVQLIRGDCRGGFGFVQKGSGDVRILRSAAAKKIQPVPAAPAPAATASGATRPNPASTAPTKASPWESRWGISSPYYVAFKAGLAQGVAGLTDMSFVGGVEIGYVPIRHKAFTLSLPFTYYSPGNIEVDSNIQLDVHLITLAASPAWRLPFGAELPWFAQMRGDLGLAVALGEFGTPATDVTDYSLLLRPALGLGHQESGAATAYVFEVGAGLMPVGFGFTAATIDATLGIQYWF